MSDIRTVVDWLTDGARSGTLSEDVLVELCRRMVDAGVPLWRAAVFVNTLHPDVIGRAFIWQVDTGVKVSEANYDLLETDEYLQSPVVAVYASRRPLRRHGRLMPGKETRSNRGPSSGSSPLTTCSCRAASRRT